MRQSLWGSMPFLFIFVLSGSMLRAQELQIRYVDLEKVLASAPGAEEANKIFDEEVETWKGEAEDLQVELQGEIEEYENQRLILSPEKKREKEDALAAKKKEYDRKVAEIQNKIQQRSTELSQPILDNIYKTIEVMAERESFDFVFESSLGAIVYASPSLDITQLVVEELKKNSGN